nr:hypothetical protein CFP56_77793 [Quercus suber]
MNKAVSNRIANEIGNSLMVDTPKSGLNWGLFLHIRVDINITKPLMRGTPVTLQQSQRVIHFGWDINPILSSNSKVPLTVADGDKSLVYIQQLLQKFPMITST